MPWVAFIAYLFTAVATLRAGSRLTYLWLHDGYIGTMDGPLILPCCGDNDEASLWEITYSLEKAVQLALSPAHDEACNNKLLLSKFPLRSSLNKRFQVCNVFQNRKSRVNKPSDELALTSPSSNTDLIKYHDRSNKVSSEKTNASLLIHFNQSTAKFSLPILSAVKTAPRLLNNLVYRSFTTIIESPYKVFRKHAFQKTSQFTNYLSDLYSSYFYASWRRSSNTALQSFYNIPESSSYSAFIHSCKTTSIDIPTSTTTTSSIITTNKSFAKHAKLTAIAPEIFQRLRTKFGIGEQDYLESLKTPFISFQSNSKGAARAGLSFFFTRDGAYMIKSIKRSEAETLLKILPAYNAYMQRHARRTLLTRICGVYEVSLGDDNRQQHHTLLVMNSVFPAEASHFISERFDLKGSTVGRECSFKEQQEKGLNNVVQKDLNLAKEVSRSLATTSGDSEYGLHLGTRAKAALLCQLRQDAMFLAHCGVMDYSLLVGVVNMEKSGKAEASAPSHLISLANKFSRHQKLLLLKEDKVVENSNKGKLSLPPSIQRLPRHVANLCSFPLRAIAAPPLYILKKTHSVTEVTLSTVLTLPLPYYGAGICGVDGGALSVLHGKRLGRRAVYYFGIIDFLQPWTMRKVLERELKHLMGYNKHAISCVHPNEYSARFINFLDAHIT